MEKFKKNLLAKMFIASMAVVLLNAVYWGLSANSGYESEFTKGFGGGLCFAMIFYAAFSAFRLYMVCIDEKKLEQLYIRSTDERYALIREKTASGSFVASAYIVCFGTVVSSFFSKEITIALACVVAVMTVCKLCFKFYYDRKY
ncbi:MAG: hypothetical protein NC395_11460 [Prevotella sp.]|nr:hypothetical protein [Prevotella sp.]